MSEIDIWKMLGRLDLADPADRGVACDLVEEYQIESLTRNQSHWQNMRCRYPNPDKVTLEMLHAAKRIIATKQVTWEDVEELSRSIRPLAMIHNINSIADAIDVAFVITLSYPELKNYYEESMKQEWEDATGQLRYMCTDRLSNLFYTRSMKMLPEEIRLSCRLLRPRGYHTVLLWHGPMPRDYPRRDVNRGIVWVLPDRQRGREIKAKYPATLDDLLRME